MRRLTHPATVATLTAGLIGLTACSTSDSNAATTFPPVTDSPTSSSIGTTEQPSAPTTSANSPVGHVAATGCTVTAPMDQVLDVDSAVFGSMDRVSVHFTPCTVDQPTPNAIVYLLHGAGADETQWPDVDIFTAADTAVRNGTMPPSILVAPAAMGGYSCSDCANDLLMHLLDEIEPAIARTAPVDPTHRAIGGISRGGGLALQVAGLAPGDFVAVGAHSSVSAPQPTLAAIAEAGLPVRFDVGDADGLAARAEDMTAFIAGHGGRAELVVGPGGHDRDYWRSQADAYIAFYADHLR